MRMTSDDAGVRREREQKGRRGVLVVGVPL